MTSDINQQTYDAWQPEAERLFQNANIKIGHDEMDNLYTGIYLIFGVYFTGCSR